MANGDGSSAAGASTEEGRAAQRQRRARSEGPTHRVVLRRESVIVVPEGVDVASLLVPDTAKLRKLGVKANVQAWVVVGEFEGESKTKAIEAHAGLPNTPDAIPGAYKAPTVAAWAGGEEYTKPAAPKVERTPLP